MAATFTIEHARWNVRKLSAFLDGWASRAPVPLLARQPWERRASGPWTWLFPDGGIRGCSLLFLPAVIQAPSLQVRLNLMASRADWQLAHGLLRALIDAAGGRLLDPDGEPMPKDRLREPEAGIEALAYVRQDAQRVVAPLRDGRPYVALPNPDYTLFVTVDHLPEEHDETRFAMALEEELQVMAARYQSASRVPVIELPDGTGLSIWSQDDALLHLTHYVGVRRGEGATEGLVIAGPALLDALGERIEVVSENHDCFYLPALDLARPEDARLHERLMKEGEPLDDWVARLGSPHADNALPHMFGTRDRGNGSS